MKLVVLAGGTAFAAGQLGKNTVGAKQLKKNAVTAAKIKNGAITGAKVNAASFGTAPSASFAATAGNANTVNGQTITKVCAKIPKGTTATIATIGPLTLRAECEAVSGDVEAFEVLSGQLADLVGGSIGNEGQSFDRESGTNNSLELDDGSVADNSRGVASCTASLADGATFSGVIGFDDAKTFGTEESCAFYGHVTS